MQNCVIVRDGSRTESGNEFHSDGPETENLLWLLDLYTVCILLEVDARQRSRKSNKFDLRRDATRRDALGVNGL